jgi:hypothetical protein
MAEGSKFSVPTLVFIAQVYQSTPSNKNQRKTHQTFPNLPGCTPQNGIKLLETALNGLFDTGWTDLGLTSGLF